MWQYDDPRQAQHRAEHGWAPKDTCSLNTYLCGVISASLRYFIEHNHAGTGEEQARELHAIADACDRYAARLAEGFRHGEPEGVEIVEQMKRLFDEDLFFELDD